MAIIATSYDINDPQEDHSTHAMELDEEGDIKGAIASFKAASRFQPSQSYTWNNLGTALADEGNPSRNEDLKQARRSFRKAVEADPDNEDAAEMFKALDTEISEGEIPGTGAGITAEIRLTPVWKEVLRMWILYHIVQMQFAHIILYVDINKQNTEEDVVCEVTMKLAQEVMHELPKHVRDKVTLLNGADVIRAATDLSGKPEHGVRWELVWRQRLYVEDGFERADRLGLRWVFHIDVDELFVLPPPGYPLPAEGVDHDLEQQPQTVVEHFAKAEEMGVGQITYYNLEGVVENKKEQIDTQNFFDDIQLFKAHAAMHSLKEGRELTLHKAVGYHDHYKWFQGYGQGKSVGRVGHCSGFGVHSFELAKATTLKHAALHEHFDQNKDNRDKDNLVFTPGLPVAYVVHYINAGFEFWRSKYEILGVFNDGYYGNPSW
jgi:hypothetical protein